MRLGKINSLLRRFGFVLVVSTGDAGEPTRLWFERAKTYDRRPPK